ncbi:MAG: thioredoxin [Pseudomonadota bacterium]
MDIIGGPQADLIKDSTDQSFMEDVIEASNEVPVLVDFWAPWCGPCKTLTPIIEKAVTSQAGKVKLVKVNIDDNPGIAGQLGVRSIPAVFAFQKGQPVDGFMGAQSEGQITQFIEKLLAGTDDGKAIADAIEQADAMFTEGDVGGAAQLYATIVNHDPGQVAAIAGLARCYLANGDADRARETLELAPEDKRSDPAWISADTAVNLQADAPSADEFAGAIAKVEAAPGDWSARHELAEALISAGRHGEAVDQLLTILAADLTWEDGKARETLLTVFEAAGPKDPITVEGRRRLSSLMFA